RGMVELRKPEVAVRAVDDLARPALQGGERGFGDDRGIGRAELADPVAELLGEPEVLVRPDRDAGRGTIPAGSRILPRNRTRCRVDPVDLVAGRVRDPDIAVGTPDDRTRPGLHHLVWELRHLARRRDHSDLAAAAVETLTEPETVPRTGGDRPREGQVRKRG